MTPAEMAALAQALQPAAPRGPAWPPFADRVLAHWPTDHNRALVLQGYAAIKDQPLLLADIALMSGVFSDNTEAHDAFSAGVMIGRQQVGNGIIKACNADPLFLYTLFEKRKPKG